jgi:hypothetical protein
MVNTYSKIDIIKAARWPLRVRKQSFRKLSKISPTGARPHQSDKEFVLGEDFEGNCWMCASLNLRQWWSKFEDEIKCLSSPVSPSYFWSDGLAISAISETFTP